MHDNVSIRNKSATFMSCLKIRLWHLKCVILWRFFTTYCYIFLKANERGPKYSYMTSIAPTTGIKGKVNEKLVMVSGKVQLWEVEKNTHHIHNYIEYEVKCFCYSFEKTENKWFETENETAAKKSEDDDRKYVCFISSLVFFLKNQLICNCYVSLYAMFQMIAIWTNNAMKNIRNVSNPGKALRCK